MKKILSLILIVLILTSNSLVFAGEVSTIRVRGEGLVKLKADSFNLSFSIRSEDQDQKKALNLNNNESKKVKLKLLELGIAESDISNEIYIRPVYDYTENKEEFKGFQVSNNFSIKSNDIGRAGVFIKELNDLGVSYIGNMSYESSKSNEAYQKALEKSYLDALKKADSIARVMKLEIKGASRVEELSSNRYFNKESAARMDGGAPELHIDDLDISASLQVDFIY